MPSYEFIELPHRIFVIAHAYCVVPPSGFEIWLGKILVNDVRFTKFAKDFPCHCFALYSIACSFAN